MIIFQVFPVHVLASYRCMINALPCERSLYMFCLWSALIISVNVIHEAFSKYAESVQVCFKSEEINNLTCVSLLVGMLAIEK